MIKVHVGVVSFMNFWSCKQYIVNDKIICDIAVDVLKYAHKAATSYKETEVRRPP